MEAKLDMLEKRLEEAQKERKKTEEKFKKCERHEMLLFFVFTIGFSLGKFLN